MSDASPAKTELDTFYPLNLLNDNDIFERCLYKFVCSITVLVSALTSSSQTSVTDHTPALRPRSQAVSSSTTQPQKGLLPHGKLL